MSEPTEFELSPAPREIFHANSLDWIEKEGSWYGKTRLGNLSYRVSRSKTPNKWDIYFDDGMWFAVMAGPFENVDTAKAAAQSDYESLARYVAARGEPLRTDPQDKPIGYIVTTSRGRDYFERGEPEPISLGVGWTVTPVYDRPSPALRDDYGGGTGSVLDQIPAEALSSQTSGAEAVAVRYGFDGHGYQYLDNGSGSDWKTRQPDGEFLFTHALSSPASEPAGGGVDGAPMTSTEEPDFLKTLMGAASMAESEARDETDGGKVWTLNFLAGKLRDAAFVITTQRRALPSPASSSPAEAGASDLAGRLKFEAEHWSASTFEDVQDGAKLMAEAADFIAAQEPVAWRYRIRDAEGLSSPWVLTFSVEDCMGLDIESEPLFLRADGGTR